MKHGTENKLKFKKLQRRLGLTLWQCKGLLQSLWDFARDNAPAGDVGRFSDEELCIGIDWAAPPDELIGALTDNGWLDRTPDGILCIHDWPEHCEDTIHNKLARAKLYFADGSTPKLTRLSEREKLVANEFYNSPARTAYARHTHDKHVPDPALPDLTSPHQNPATPSVQERTPAAGPGLAGACADERQAGKPSVFSSINIATLKDPERLDAWWRMAAASARPVVTASQQDRLRVHGAAERAVDPKSKARSAVGLFVSTVTKPHWDRITQEQEIRAQERIKELDRIARGDPEYQRSGEPSLAD